MLIDLNEYLSDEMLNNLDFNIGVFIASNYFIIGYRESQNYQLLGISIEFKEYAKSQDQVSTYMFNTQNTPKVYVTSFDYDSGNISLVSFKISDSSNNQILPSSSFMSQEITIWIINGISYFFTLFFVFLIVRRKRRRQFLCQYISAILFQSQCRMSKIEFQSKYDINYHDSLGQGGFGDVFRATNIHKKIIANKDILKKMEDQYACKRIICNKEIGIDQQLKQITNEIQILLQLKQYKHVIQLTNYYIEENQAILAFELADTNLQKAIQLKQEDYDKFDESDVVKFLDQIGNTLADIYQIEQIAHRDIKPDNIMIKSGNYYLSDFGISQQTGTFNDKDHIVLGSIKWMSPELKNLKIDDFSKIQQDIDFFKSDMFSLGLVLLFMLTLIDISQVNQDDVLKKTRLSGLRINRSKDIDEQILILVSKMLENNTEKRPDPQILKKSIEQIKQKHNRTNETFIEM